MILWSSITRDVGGGTPHPVLLNWCKKVRGAWLDSSDCMGFQNFVVCNKNYIFCIIIYIFLEIRRETHKSGYRYFDSHHLYWVIYILHGYWTYIWLDFETDCREWRTWRLYMVTGQDFFLSCPRYFFPHLFSSSYLLPLFQCLISILLFPCAGVWENTRAWVPHFL